MTFKKGESGDPTGGLANRKYLDALRVELAADPDHKTLRRIVRKAIRAAERGEPWAIKHIAERLDGKPPQAIALDARVSSPLDDLYLEIASLHGEGAQEGETTH